MTPYYTVLGYIADTTIQQVNVTQDELYFVVAAMEAEGLETVVFKQ